MKKRLLPILAILMSIIVSSCGTSAAASSEDAAAIDVPIDGVVENSDAIPSEDAGIIEEPTVSDVPASSEAPSSSEAVSSKATSSSGKQTTVIADNDYSVSVEDKGDKVSDTVYITDDGTKYHRSGCRYLKDSKHEISRADAKAQGYEPCKVCNP